MKLGLTPLQLEERKLGIGASDAGFIVAGGEDARKLWRIKTGRQEDDDLSDVLAVQMGSYTEELNVYWYTKQTGREVTHRNVHVKHPDISYLIANLDGITTTSQGEPAYIDFKHVGRSGDQLTLRYTAQCTHCALILNALHFSIERWVLSTFIGNSKWELTEQEVDPFFALEYLAKCKEFWGYVERDEEPPLAAPLPVPPPQKLRTVSLEDVDISAWPNWGGDVVSMIRTFAETEPAHVKHIITREVIKQLVPDDVGTITRGRFKYARDRAGAVRMSLKKGEKE
jgi:YqaJ-like viral recombinase domain